MFEQIQEVIEIESSLVIVLIDEVESIAYTRSAISSKYYTHEIFMIEKLIQFLNFLQIMNQQTL